MTQTSTLGQDHDRGLEQLSATVLNKTRPTPGITRIEARLSANSLEWSRPNVAFRIHLGEISRIYTVRDHDALNATITFDVVHHEGASPMMAWIHDIRMGDSFLMTGPRAHSPIPEAPGRRVALFLDDTGMPALYAMLRQWPEGLEGTGWVATLDQEAFAQLPRVAGLDLQRITPQRNASDEEGALAIRARVLAHPEHHVVWGAGERGEMRAIRRHFIDVVGLDRRDLALSGYWKRGVSNTSIDQRRQEAYERLLARGGTLEEFDDLAVEV